MWEMLKSFLRNFQNPHANPLKVFYNIIAVVESGAKCSEIPQDAVKSPKPSKIKGRRLKTQLRTH